MKTYKHVLFLVIFAFFLSSPSFAQSGNGGLGSGGDSVPHSGIGDCGAGFVVQRLNANAKPTCVANGGGGGGGVTSVVNDTNVTGSIAGSVLTLGWQNTLAILRGGLGSGITPTAAQIPVAQNGTQYAPETIHGDGSIAVDGTLTIVDIDGVTPGGNCPGTPGTNQQFAFQINSSAVPSCMAPINGGTCPGGQAVTAVDPFGGLTCSATGGGTVTGGTSSCPAGQIQTGTTISSTGVPTAICTQKTDKFSCPLAAAATNNAILCDIPMTEAETVPVNCGSSAGTSVVAASGSTTFTIKKITSGGSSTTIGTAVWSASGKTAAFTCASPVTFAATDLLEIDGPATGDTLLTQGGLTISANAGAL